jgi:mercuric reductase
MAEEFPLPEEPVHEGSRYDLVILGGDIASLATIVRYRELLGDNKKVAFVSRDIASDFTIYSSRLLPKYLIELTKISKLLKIYSRRGFSIRLEASIDYSNILSNLKMIAETIRKRRFERILDLYKMDLYIGSAKFTSTKTVQVFSKDRSVEIEGVFFVIATGSSPVIPDIEGLNEIKYYTTDTIWSIEDLPREILVVGSEPIGLEIAQALSRLGSEVCIVESAERILPMAEPEISRELSEIFAEEGIKIYTKTKIISFRRRGSGIIARFMRSHESFEKEFDTVLFAIGRRPNIDGLGLDTAGVELDKRGFIAVSKDLRTSNPRIYAAGDVAGTPKPALTDIVSIKEGAVVAENIAYTRKRSIDYDLVPVIIYTDPEIAYVGLTEQRLFKTHGMSSHKVVKFNSTIKSEIISEERGLAKIIVDPRDKRIVGFHVIAPNASEFISVASLLIKHGYKVKDYVELTHIFPASYEILKLAASAYISSIDEFLHHLY